jgi:hypothetical protein
MSRQESFKSSPYKLAATNRVFKSITTKKLDKVLSDEHKISTPRFDKVESSFSFGDDKKP